MRIEKFEDIEGWQHARQLTRMVYAATRKPLFARDFAMSDQIRRASLSAMLNVAEGFDGGGNAEFVKFLRYAQRSCTEVQSALYAALDQEYIAESEFASLSAHAKRTHAVIGGFIKYLLGAEHQKPAPSHKAPATKNQERRTKNESSP